MIQQKLTTKLHTVTHNYSNIAALISPTNVYDVYNCPRYSLAWWGGGISLVLARRVPLCCHPRVGKTTPASLTLALHKPKPLKNCICVFSVGAPIQY